MASTKFGSELPSDAAGIKTSAVPTANISTTQWTTPVHITGTATGYGASSGATVTPNDTTTFAATKGVFIGVSGDLKVDMADGTAITFKGLSAGVIHPLSIIRVYATGTTALEIVRLS